MCVWGGGGGVGTRPWCWCCVLGGGGGCSITLKEYAGQVLPGVRTCAASDEEILHSWMGGLVAYPLG